MFESKGVNVSDRDGDLTCAKQVMLLFDDQTMDDEYIQDYL